MHQTIKTWLDFMSESEMVKESNINISDNSMKKLYSEIGEDIIGEVDEFGNGYGFAVDKDGNITREGNLVTFRFEGVVSRHPTQTDPYEDRTVYVSQSKITNAGEGLFAKRSINKGGLACLFNGTKCLKTARYTMIRADSPDWSDYRVTLDKDVDLDVPEQYIDLENYKATLGHKACHSFADPNAAFSALYHPRFGRIMSIVAKRLINQDEEILVNYNYSLEHAPTWYQEAYGEYQKSQL